MARLNADLANDLGNLLQRTLGMVGRYLEGRIPPAGEAMTDGDRGLRDHRRPGRAGCGRHGGVRLPHAPWRSSGVSGRRQSIHRQPEAVGVGQAGHGGPRPRPGPHLRGTAAGGVAPLPLHAAHGRHHLEAPWPPRGAGRHGDRNGWPLGDHGSGTGGAGPGPLPAGGPCRGGGGHGGGDPGRTDGAPRPRRHRSASTSSAASTSAWPRSWPPKRSRAQRNC